MNIIESLQNRYATKSFDSTKKLSDVDLETLLESARLAPSSFGLEPWKFVVVTNPETRAQLQGAAWGQAQIVDASHLIVIAAKKTMTADDVDQFIARTASVRGMDVAMLSGYADMIKGTLASRTPEQIEQWNKRQTYIALGFILETAAMMGIDACPMEGFNPEAFDDILGLLGSDYGSVVLCPVGYRSADDKYATAPKVRKSIDEVVVRIA